MYVQKPTSEFTPTPAGLWEAVCCRFVDLGTHEEDGRFGHVVKREILISWQIPEHRIEYDGKDLPLIHNQRYTWSMNEKANLRKQLEGWRGAPFAEKDLAGPPDGFNTKNLIGVGCQLQIMHNENGKAKLTAILPLKKDRWPAVEGETTYFQMQQAPLDMDAFERLSSYYKGLIETSPEWALATGNAPAANERGGGGLGDLDDDIPFAPEWR